MIIKPIIQYCKFITINNNKISDKERWYRLEHTIWTPSLLLSITKLLLPNQSISLL